MNGRTFFGSMFVAGLLLTVATSGVQCVPDIGPWPSPVDPVAVDSPFPADGWYLLVAGESQDLTGIDVSANAESIRTLPGLNRRVLDYDKIDLEPEPWKSALAHAKQASGGTPYYVMRHGNAASEGKLPAGIPEQYDVLTKALEGAK